MAIKPTTQKKINDIIEDHVQRWNLDSKKKYKNPIRPVITISRLPGSGGSIVGKSLAEDLKIDFFDNEIIEAVAADAKVSDLIVKTLDEQDHSVLSDWIAALTSEKQLWPYEYLRHLTRVVGTIGTHGHAIILGRGASFILPKEVCLRVLIVSPLEIRVDNVVKTHKIKESEAKKRVMRTESDRKAFIRRYFNADMMDPVNYDIVINTHLCTMDNTVDIIKTAFNSRHWYNYAIKK